MWFVGSWLTQLYHATGGRRPAGRHPDGGRRRLRSWHTGAWPLSAGVAGLSRCWWASLRRPTLATCSEEGIPEPLTAPAGHWQQLHRLMLTAPRPDAPGSSRLARTPPSVVLTPLGHSLSRCPCAPCSPTRRVSSLLCPARSHPPAARCAPLLRRGTCRLLFCWWSLVLTSPRLPTVAPAQLRARPPEVEGHGHRRRRLCGNQRPVRPHHTALSPIQLPP